MKKVLCIFILFSISVLSLFSYSSISDNLVRSFLYPENQVTILFDLKDPLLTSELVYELEMFSIKHGINIINSNVFWDNTIHLYVTNIQNHPDLTIIEGNYPTGRSYLHNAPLNNINPRNSGQFALPNSRFDIRIFEMSQVINSGFSQNLHLLGLNEEIYYDFVMKFSDFVTSEMVNYDEILHSELDRHFLQSVLTNEYFDYEIISTNVTVLGFIFGVLFVLTSLYVVGKKKNITTMHHFGFNVIHSVWYLGKQFIYFVTFASIAILLIIFLHLSKNGLSIFFPNYLSQVILSILIFLLIFIIFLAFNIFIVYFFGWVTIN